MTTEPYPNWHCVEIVEAPDGWQVRCTPHGPIGGTHPTHLEAIAAGYEHDLENGTLS